MQAVVEDVAARMRGEALHEAVEHAMRGDAATRLAVLLTDRETLKVIHRKLHELGWQQPWGEGAHNRLYKALCEFFGDDDAHLRHRRGD